VQLVADYVNCSVQFLLTISKPAPHELHTDKNESENISKTGIWKNEQDSKHISSLSVSVYMCIYFYVFCKRWSV
jgi:hypothetical protein